MNQNIAAAHLSPQLPRRSACFLEPSRFLHSILHLIHPFPLPVCAGKRTDKSVAMDTRQRPFRWLPPGIEDGRRLFMTRGFPLMAEIITNGNPAVFVYNGKSRCDRNHTGLKAAAVSQGFYMVLCVLKAPALFDGDEQLTALHRFPF